MELKKRITDVNKRNRGLVVKSTVDYSMLSHCTQFNLKRFIVPLAIKKPCNSCHVRVLKKYLILLNNKPSLFKVSNLLTLTNLNESVSMTSQSWGINVDN